MSKKEEQGMFGKVTTYSTSKKYGYIEGDDGESYFVHESDIKTPSRGLVPGYSVQFSISSGFPKKKAVNVSLL